MLQDFCREHDLVFILDEVQANFGRTGELFAYETYGMEPDMVVLGKGLGNGVPVAAAVGRADLFASLDYGEGSDTWSANPLCCAAVLATLEEFAAGDVLGQSRRTSAVLEEGLVRLKEFPFIAHVRGEKGGMVWGVEMATMPARPPPNGPTPSCWPVTGAKRAATAFTCGAAGEEVIRIAPPLVLTETEARAAAELMFRILKR